MATTYRWARRNDGDKSFFFRRATILSIGVFVRGDAVPDTVDETEIRRLWRTQRIVLRDMMNPPASRKPSGGISIVEAIGWLDTEDPSQWTSMGVPRVDVLEGLIGRDIAAKDRDEAWAEAVKNQAAE